MYLYQPTRMEKLVSDLFRRIGVDHPTDINEKKIASYFRIYLKKMPIKSFSYQNGRFASITLDQRLSLEDQREQFYHELCHLLRHCGWQAGILPQMFQDLQEWDANRFTLFGSIPFHMLHYIDFNSITVVQDTAELFGVTENLVKKRIAGVLQKL
ncbi:ImmA/IrrE family metallo-endopeptidase [Sutcliffiella cohnii]